VVKVIKKKGKRTLLEVGDWIVGMLEWSQYMKTDYTLIQKLPIDVKIT
jgi:NADPH-dependent curcumin reductase CurA